MTVPLARHTLEAGGVRTALQCESQLRVAANMLSRAHVDEISATTVVGVLGADDADAFAELVADICDELDLDARVRRQVGSFSVRFMRHTSVGESGVDLTNS